MKILGNISNNKDIVNKEYAESSTNKVTEIDANSTDIQYPSAKSVFTYINDIIVDDLYILLDERWYDTNLASNLTWLNGYYYDKQGEQKANVNYICSSNYIQVIEGQTYKLINFTEDQTVYLQTNRVGMFTNDSSQIDSNSIKGFLIKSGSPSSEIYPSVIPSEWEPDHITFTVPIGTGISRLYLDIYAPTSHASYGSQVQVYQKKPIYLIMDDKKTNLKDKKWTSFGDSITYREQWQPNLINKYGLTHTNCGIGSTCLAGTDANAFWQDVRLNAVKASDPDILTILGGANDLNPINNITIGTDAEFSKTLVNKDKSTFIGAYSYIIETLLAWKPTLRIVILGTTWAHNDGADYSQTLTYTDFSNASELVAKHYGLPFVDLHGNCGFNQFTMGDSPYNIYSTDYIHPNEAGGKIIAEQVDKVFEKMFIF